MASSRPWSVNSWRSLRRCRRTRSSGRRSAWESWSRSLPEGLRLEREGCAVHGIHPPNKNKTKQNKKIYCTDFGFGGLGLKWISGQDNLWRKFMRLFVHLQSAKESSAQLDLFIHIKTLMLAFPLLASLLSIFLPFFIGCTPSLVQ